MTRWARAKNVYKHKSTDAASWSQLRAGIADGGNSSDSHLQDDASHSYPDGKRANKYRQLDGNGFMEYMKHKRQRLPKGCRGMATEEQDIRKVVAITIKKNKRRENRRIKRQDATKSNMVCFNCRKPGHGLADCPKADEEMGRGICFRCGSTEHEIQRCRAKVDPAMGDYPYAKCFICGKTGHLSKSCPDNPKGLYAAGGCCRICGSVEHFQKDCPDHQTSKRNLIEHLWDVLDKQVQSMDAPPHNLPDLKYLLPMSWYQMPQHTFRANSITLGRLSNKISADHEDISVPVTQVSLKKVKVVVY